MGLKFGTMLVREGVISSQQLEEALRVQVLYGGRFGTSLIELNYVDAPTLGHWLAKYTGFPAVDEVALLNAPDDLLQLIPPELAEKYECFPLHKDGRRLHIAMVNPTDLSSTDTLAFKTGLRLVPYVVPEFILYSALEKRMGIERKLRYVRLSQRTQSGSVAAVSAPSEGVTPKMAMPVPGNGPLASSLSGSRSAMPTPSESPTPLRNTIPPIGSARSSVSGIPAVTVASELPPLPAGWSSSPNVARTSPSMPPTPISWAQAPAPVSMPPKAPPPPNDVQRAIGALASARTRDDIAGALLAFAPERHDTMLLFVVREELALGWKGRGLGIHERLVDNVMLPLNTPSMFQEAFERRSPALGPVGDPQLHRHFFKALGRNPPQAAVVVPVLVRNRPVNLIYVDRLASTDVTSLMDPLVEVAKHVASAYERILVEGRRAAS